MKSLFLLLSVLLSGIAIAQQKDISVFEKKEGNKNIVVARNIGKVPYLVTLNIHATGMDVVPGLKAEAVVQPGFMKELATLTPQPGASWTYGYDVAFAPATTSGTTSPATPPATTPSFSTQQEKGSPSAVTAAKAVKDDSQIIVYTQPGCSRCSFVKKGLNDKGIKFKEVDVTSNTPDVSDMWMNLRHGGFNGESVTMPVVKVNGQLHYNIKDLQKFISEMK